MANYRTTIILKTDIVDSTPRLAGQTQAEMSLQRKQHKQFIAETAVKQNGTIFQEEGDAYWIEFPSVTNACLAAIEMHQNLRSMQAGKGEKQRLVIRAVITAGDILHEGNDSMGMTMSLTARLEKVTPPDEIYLSHAAWLVLNKAEVQTSFVNEFNFKGFDQPEKIYRVEQSHRSRILIDQFILFTDVRGWTSYTKSNGIEVVENFLMDYDDVMNDICERHNGVIRNTSGDTYFVTFSEADAIFPATRDLCASWKKMVERYQLGISVAVHKGNLNIIRSYLYSNDIHTTMFLERLTGFANPARETISVVVSGKVKASAIGTNWESRFQDYDGSAITEELYKSVIDEHGAYWFIAEGD
jgi:class 3 adenylate cyclase